MPVSRNALIRYKTIDTCLRNRFRKWTLEDLVDACSDALYEYEGIDKGISKRTVQMDIQLMRSEKLGYNAPIVVKDHKYYTYEDPEYSITQTPLNEQDLKNLSGSSRGWEVYPGSGETIQWILLFLGYGRHYQSSGRPCHLSPTEDYSHH